MGSLYIRHLQQQPLTPSLKKRTPTKQSVSHEPSPKKKDRRRNPSLNWTQKTSLVKLAFTFFDTMPSLNPLFVLKGCMIGCKVKIFQLITLQEITVYLIRKLNQKLVILTFGLFDHLVILDKSIWTFPTWLVVFLTNHKMVFLTSQIGQKIRQPKK